jgi:hypothetical protein
MNALADLWDQGATHLFRITVAVKTTPYQHYYSVKLAIMCSAGRLTFQVVSACSLSCCMLASLQMQLLLKPRVSAVHKAGERDVLATSNATISAAILLSATSAHARARQNFEQQFAILTSDVLLLLSVAANSVVACSQSRTIEGAHVEAVNWAHSEWHVL